MPTPQDEHALRIDLAAAYQVFAIQGWTHLIHTHITVAVSGEEEAFLINPFGLLWEEITASSLVKVNAAGEILEQGTTDLGINPAGFEIHSVIHTSPRQAKWVLHFHVPEVVAVANLKQGLIRGLSTYSMDLGPISYHAYEHATTDGSDVCQRMLDDFDPDSRILLLRNHGAIIVGDSIHAAFFLAFQLVEACKVQLLTLSAAGESGHHVVPDPILEATYEIVQANYTGEGFGKKEWEAAKRAMEATAGVGYLE